MGLIAVGVPVLTGPAQGWNFWPLLGIPFALLIAFRWFRLPRRIWIVVVAIVAGLASGDAIGAWGVLPVVVGVVCLIAAGSLAEGLLRRAGPPTV